METLSSCLSVLMGNYKGSTKSFDQEGFDDEQKFRFIVSEGLLCLVSA